VKWVEFRGADAVPLSGKQHHRMREWLAWDEPRAVGDLAHVEKFFARNLGGLIRVRRGIPDRLMKAIARR